MVPAPVGFLDTWLQALDAGLLRVKQRGASFANLSPNATMSMHNHLPMAVMGNLSPLAPPVGFSNAGGTRNLCATTAGVSMDQFNQLLAGCDTLEAVVRELKASLEDSSIKINSKSFSSLQEFVMFYNQDVLRVDSPGALADDAELQVCFLDWCGLLALAYHDMDYSTIKTIAELMNLVQKAVFKGVSSLVITNTFERKLLEAFGKSATGVSKTPLPGLATFKAFDTQMIHTSFKHNLLLRV